MKNPHLRPRLLISAFIIILLLGSSLSCDTKFDLPLFYGLSDEQQDLSPASNTILATLPDILSQGVYVSFPPGAPVLKALRTLFKFLEEKNVTGFPKNERDAVYQLNAQMLEVDKRVSNILSTKLGVDVKKDWLTAVNICEKVFASFTDSKSVFSKGKLASAPYYVAFATIYVTVAQLGMSLNRPYIPKLKEDMKRLLADLSEFEFAVKPERKYQLREAWDLEIFLKDYMTGSRYRDKSCRGPWRDEITKGIKKFFGPIKESVAAFAGVPVPVRYQYYTRWGGECYFSCDFHEGKSYSWCWTLNDGLGVDWGYCSEKKDFTIYGKECRNHCKKAGWDYYWCYTTGYSWDYCSTVKVQ